MCKRDLKQNQFNLIEMGVCQLFENGGQEERGGDQGVDIPSIAESERCGCAAAGGAGGVVAGGQVDHRPLFR